MRPAVQQLQIELAGRGGLLNEGKEPLTIDSPAVQAVHGALLALQPLGVSEAWNGWVDAPCGARP